MSVQQEALVQNRKVWPALNLVEAAPILGDAMERSLSTLGKSKLPDSNHELWRYTRPELFGFDRLEDRSAVRCALRPHDGGALLPAAAGIEVLEGEPARTQGQQAFKQLFGALGSDLALDSFAALNLVSASSITLVQISKQARSLDPWRLSQLISNTAARSAAPLIVITVAAGARCSIVEDLDFNYAGLYFPRVEILLGDGCEFEFTSVQRLALSASYAARHRLHVGRDVNARVLHVATGANASRVDLDCRLHQPGSSVDLCAWYLADGRRHVDFHPTQDHLAPHCRSDLMYKGVLRDHGRAVYYGYIRVAEGAQKTDAYQTNRNMLLSSDARADSIPNLRIQANDVRCSHGSSVGQVGTDELFYLMSRGLTRSMAEELLVQGFTEDLLTRVKNPLIREFARGVILERIEQAPLTLS